LEQIILNTENPEVELEFTPESYLLIKSISITSLKNISSIKLTAELKYVDDGRFSDEIPIYLITESHQVEPVFQLNKLLKNEMGINQGRKFFNRLKLKFTCVEDDDNIQMTINCLSNKINRIENKGDSTFESALRIAY